MQERKGKLHSYTLNFCSFLLAKQRVLAGLTEQQAHGSKLGVMLTPGPLQEKWDYWNVWDCREGNKSLGNQTSLISLLRKKFALNLIISSDDRWVWQFNCFVFRSLHIVHSANESGRRTTMSCFLAAALWISITSQEGGEIPPLSTEKNEHLWPKISNCKRRPTESHA